MKNKKLAYILVPLVAIIWGIIFYRIYIQLTKNDNVVTGGITLQNDKKDATATGSYQLLLNYRDPFQGYTFRTQQKISVQEKNLSRNNQQSPKPTESFNWPSFIYSGIIVNKKSNAKTAILNFNNKNLLVKEGEVYEGYKILKIHNDSIQIGFNKLRKTINRL